MSARYQLSNVMVVCVSLQELKHENIVALLDFQVRDITASSQARLSLMFQHSAIIGLRSEMRFRQVV